MRELRAWVTEKYELIDASAVGCDGHLKYASKHFELFKGIGFMRDSSFVKAWQRYEEMSPEDRFNMGC